MWHGMIFSSAFAPATLSTSSQTEEREEEEKNSNERRNEKLVSILIVHTNRNVLDLCSCRWLILVLDSVCFTIENFKEKREKKWSEMKEKKSYLKNEMSHRLSQLTIPSRLNKRHNFIIMNTECSCWWLFVVVVAVCFPLLFFFDTRLHFCFIHFGACKFSKLFSTAVNEEEACAIDE